MVSGGVSAWETGGVPPSGRQEYERPPESPKELLMCGSAWEAGGGRLSLH